jgi:predicted PolB exonuclease-like 3'-5' exonuclease
MFLDIASVPGFELGARLYGLHDLSDKDIARVMSTKNREKGRNSDELGQHQLQVAAISVLLQDDDGIKLQTSGGPRTDELHHLQFLTSIIDQHKPEIITWDRRTILPVLNYRCLTHGYQTPFARVAEVIDLKSELSGSEYQDSVSLQEVAILSGFPGNEEMSNESVLNAYLEGAHELIRINLELNVIKACMIHQRWKLVCGEVDQSGLEKELQKLKKYLLQQDQTHLTNFIDALI